MAFFLTNVKFEPIYSRKLFKNSKHIFGGGLTLASQNEGVGLFEQELEAFLALGGKIFYLSPCYKSFYEDEEVKGVYVNGEK